MRLNTYQSMSIRKRQEFEAPNQKIIKHRRGEKKNGRKVNVTLWRQGCQSARVGLAIIGTRKELI
jgi:hypothetical protein